MKNKEETLFDVCREVNKRLERLENYEHFRFVIAYCELKLADKRKAEYEMQTKLNIPTIGLGSPR